MAKKLVAILAVVALVISQMPAFACTSFQVMAADGTKAVKFIPMADGFSAADKTDKMAEMR